MGRTFGANKAAAKEENLVDVSLSFPVLSCRSMSRLANQAGQSSWPLHMVTELEVGEINGLSYVRARVLVLGR
jgi:hypothetical protein